MSKPARPVKPTPDFPLYPHPSGKWAKKIRGQTHYFGRWEDPAGALADYRAHVTQASPDRMSGENGGLVLKDACNLFLHSKLAKVKAGELSKGLFADYRRTCEQLVAKFGRETDVASFTPAHFTEYRGDLAESRSPVSLGNEITRVRSLFKWCWEARLIPAPMHFGPDFRKPSVLVLRRHRREQGKKLLTAEEIHRVLDESGVHLRAMVLLGINAAFGPKDCATLPLGALSGTWVEYPRTKTEVERRIPLWDETREAIDASLRRRPKTDDRRVFLRPDGRPWTSPKLTLRFSGLRRAALLERGGFYWLRHTFETVGGRAKDQVAVNAIMGHADHSIAAHYREEVEDARLIAVTESVRGWLFGGE